MQIDQIWSIEEAQAKLSIIAARAHAGFTCVVTLDGKPYAAVVPFEQTIVFRRGTGLLAMRGVGKGLWGKTPAKTLDVLRDEWS